MLTAVEETARDGIKTVAAIREAFLEMKHGIRGRFPRLYSQDLLNTLFTHPHTRSSL